MHRLSTLALVALLAVGCGHPLAIPRSRHATVTLPDGDVLVVGGDRNYPPLASVARYDVRRGRWSAAASLPDGRVNHSVTTLASGAVLVAGGYGSKVEPQATAWRYEPAEDKWHPVAPMMHAHDDHVAIGLADGRVLVVDAHEDLEAAAELYDPVRNRWMSAAPPPVSVSRFTLTRLMDGRVLVVGMIFDVDPIALVYDPRTDRWTPTEPMHEPRAFHTATLLPDGRVIVVGGRHGGGPDGPQALTSTEIYEPRANRWRLGPLLVQGRSDHTATLCGRVLAIVGGSPSGWGAQRPLTSVELLDIQTGDRAFRRRGLSRNREEHTANALPDGSVMLVGGRTELIVSKWNLRWSKRLRLRGRWRKAARATPQGPLDPAVGAHGTRAPK